MLSDLPLGLQDLPEGSSLPVPVRPGRSAVVSGAARHGAVTLVPLPCAEEVVGALLQQEGLACLVVPNPGAGAPMARFWPPSCVAQLQGLAPLSGLLVGFTLADLQRHMGSHGGAAGLAGLPHPALMGPQSIALASSHQQFLLMAISHAAELIQRAHRLGAMSSAALALDALMLRSMALLLVPPGQPAHQSAPLTLQCAVDQAMAWMLANLERPISLGDLERQVRYSRRSLQLGFRERVGYGPIQWLRRQRLKRAHDQLMAMAQGSAQAAAVGSVARRCGYINLSAFSRDFSAMYGYPPSRLLQRR